MEFKILKNERFSEQFLSDIEGIEQHFEDKVKKSGIYLECGQDYVELTYYNKDLKKEIGKVFCQFEKKLNQIKKQKLNKTDPFYSSIGFKNNKNLTVVDGTFGLGEDALILSHWGAKVTCFEESFPLYLLGTCNLQKCQKRPFELVYNSFQKALKTDQKNYDVLYIDPMFKISPEKRRAKPRKEMVLFHKLLIDEKNEEDYFDEQVLTLFKRVVVKRPLKSPFLAQRKPSFSKSGKAIRFDVYIL